MIDPPRETMPVMRIGGERDVVQKRRRREW